MESPSREARRSPIRKGRWLARRTHRCHAELAHVQRFGGPASASGVGCANALRQIQRHEPNAAGGCVDEAGLPGRDVRAIGQSKASRTPETEGEQTQGDLSESSWETEGDSGRLEGDSWEASAGHAKRREGERSWAAAASPENGQCTRLLECEGRRHGYLETSVGVNDGRQAAHRHATNRVIACRVGDTLTHSAHDRGALEANWPHCARRIQIKHVEDIAKVEA